MKKINLTKYGFIKNEREDFSDDGNKFTCYTVGTRVRVSKCVSGGRAYIAARIDGNKLDYSEYSKLPHYKDMDELNGIDIAALDDQDLINLYNNCLKYEQEYIEAESKVSFPTIAELKNQCIKIREIRKAELNDITELLSKNVIKILSADKYTLSNIQQYYKNLQSKLTGFDPETYPQSVQKTVYGRNFVNRTNPDLNESYWYKNLKEMILKLN